MNKQYDFGKVLRVAALEAGLHSDHSVIDDAQYELKISREMQKQRGIVGNGITVPHQVFTRDLSVGTATAGGNLVETVLHAGSFIDVLRNTSVVMNLGATTLTGLSGNVDIPRKTSGSTATWISAEGGDATQSEPAFDKVSMTPKTIAAYADLTRQLILQGAFDVINMVRNDLAEGIATAIDLAALYGSGSSGQPTGIVNQTGINAPTSFAAAVPTWAEIVTMETAVASDNSLMLSPGYVVEPAMRGSLRTAEMFSGSGVPIWEGSSNELNGNPAIASGQVTSGDVFFGDWSDLLIGMWGGLDITIDRYTHSLSGSVRVVAMQTIDIGVRHPGSFAFNNDGV